MLRRLTSGSLEGLARPGALPGIILGSRACPDALPRTVGGSVTFLVPEAVTTPLEGLRPNRQRFRVVGTFESGFYEIDSAWAYTSLQAAQTLLDLEDVVNTVELKLDDIYQAPAVKEAADRLAGPKLAPPRGWSRTSTFWARSTWNARSPS